MDFLHHRCQCRFSAIEDGVEVGYLTYTIDNGILDITHTFVDPSKRGQGIAKELVRRCDSFSKREGLIITASCSYAAEALGMKQDNPSCRIGQ